MTPEEWAARGDAVVVARVTGGGPLDEPATVARNGRPPVTRETCDGVFRPALRLTLDDVQVVRGEAPPAAPLQFGVGACQAWGVEPAFIDGCVRWVPPGRSEGIAPGDRLGAVVVHDEAVGALLAVGPMFRVEGDGRVTFQRADGACLRPPAALDGRPLAEVAEALAALPLPDGPSVERRDLEARTAERRRAEAGALCFAYEE